jgi:hypothetical protein
VPDLSVLDRGAIEALLIEKHHQVVGQHEGLTTRDFGIERLDIIIAKLRRMMFGPRASVTTSRSNSSS